MNGGRSCGVQWCDELDQHTGAHRRILADIPVFDVDAGPDRILLYVQGESSRVRVPVIKCGTVEVGLTWPELDAFAAAMTAARRSYGT